MIINVKYEQVGNSFKVTAFGDDPKLREVSVVAEELDRAYEEFKVQASYHLAHEHSIDISSLDIELNVVKGSNDNKSQTTALIYTKKDYCPHCAAAKALFDRKKIPYEEIVVGTDITKEELLGIFEALSLPTPQTVPQIFINDEYIGGNSQLQELYKAKNG